ncbi:hypothetical protein SRABI128_02401 [Microbacterium sp. Bi128]|nr:hypothetical protein SRABI128_02401 [Microbacterium sp. Bi128]
MVEVAFSGGAPAAGEDTRWRGDAEPTAERGGHAIGRPVEGEGCAGDGVGEQADPGRRLARETPSGVEVDGAETVQRRRSGVGAEQAERGDRDDDAGTGSGGRRRGGGSRGCGCARGVVGCRRGRGEEVGERVGAELCQRALFVGRRAQVAGEAVDARHRVCRPVGGEERGERRHAIELGRHPHAPVMPGPPVADLDRLGVHSFAQGAGRDAEPGRGEPECAIEDAGVERLPRVGIVGKGGRQLRGLDGVALGHVSLGERGPEAWAAFAQGFGVRSARAHRLLGHAQTHGDLGDRRALGHVESVAANGGGRAPTGIAPDAVEREIGSDPRLGVGDGFGEDTMDQAVLGSRRAVPLAGTVIESVEQERGEGDRIVRRVGARGLRAGAVAQVVREPRVEVVAQAELDRPRGIGGRLQLGFRRFGRSTPRVDRCRPVARWCADSHARTLTRGSDIAPAHGLASSCPTAGLSRRRSFPTAGLCFAERVAPRRPSASAQLRPLSAAARPVPRSTPPQTPRRTPRPIRGRTCRARPGERSSAPPAGPGLRRDPGVRARRRRAGARPCP